VVEKKQVPIDPRMLKLPESPGDKGHLIASRCRDCGEVFFPKKPFCLNCTSPNMEEIALSTRGKLDTFTISRAVPPGSLMVAPYAIVQVALPEKAVVTAVMTDVDLESLDIGMDVEMVIEKIKEDEAGNDVMTFKFKPV
jgi:hypothetical protein